MTDDDNNNDDNDDNNYDDDYDNDENYDNYDDNYNDNGDNYNNLGGSWRDRQFVSVHIENPTNVKDLLKKRNTLSTNHVVMIKMINTIHVTNIEGDLCGENCVWDF